MAFDELLAERVREIIGDGAVEKRMFGGLAFLLNGNMSCGVHGANLIVRIDPEETGAALAEPGTRVFDMTGRPMRGWLLVDPTGMDAAGLRRWVRRGADYARTLPPR